MRLQNDAKTETYLSQHDLARYRSLLINQSLGGSYHLGWLAEKLLNLGFDLKERDGQMSMEYGFFRLLGHYAMFVPCYLISSTQPTHICCTSAIILYEKSNTTVEFQ
jgi:hypothetical protein